MVEAKAKPSGIIIKFLEEIVESWKNKRYQKVAEQCTALLKRKKTIENLGMTSPLQRILLQAYIHQDKYEKVIEWEKTVSSSNTTSSSPKCEDLVLYARYRTGDYAEVSRQSVAAVEAKEVKNESVCFQNLRAQSDFHLNRTKEGLAVYLEMLSNNSIDDSDVESKMEVLINALALIAASGCTPMVGLDDEFWLDEAEAILLSDDEAVDGMFGDLASNLGCIRFLTDPTKASATGSTENWLEEAADTGEDDGVKKGITEETNLQWSKNFWYKDIEDVHYDTSNSNANNSNKTSVTESIANVNQSLIDGSLTRLPAQAHPKWNLLQVRMYWYDRAILQLKAGKYVECHDSCQSLKKTLSNTVSSKGTKKKKNSNDTIADSSNVSQSPTSLWWDARADVILAYVQQAQSKNIDASVRLNDRLDILKASSPSLVIDHAVTHVLLHQFVIDQQQQQKGKKKDRQKQQRELLALLKSLPESIKSSPATQLTIDDLQDTVNNASSSNNTKGSPKSPLEEANMLFGEGQYEEACKLYENALSDGDDSSSTLMDSQLRYVQALAMSGRHEESQDLWQSLESTILEENSTVAESLPDGSALENKALPRTNTSSARSISNKLTVSSKANDEDNDDKPSREKILRRRTTKREAYLKELESKGNYNPDRPTKPDPERWIPKHERKRSSRGGKVNRGGGRNNNKGLNSAQGGGSKLDADRLDAAARRAGKAPASGGPSSANLKVSAGGRKSGRRR